jgi:SRSO17 transposase
MPTEDMLATATWQTINWRTGTKKKLKPRFAAVRVRVADTTASDQGYKVSNICPATRLGSSANTGCPERRKYYLAGLPAETDLRTLAATIKARWICEQAHQQMQEELGLEYFEGRSWQGLHRHALMTVIAYAFLQHRRLATAQRKKESPGRRLS